jgi:hypothetical protein
MAPKYGGDEDDDAPPCGVREDFRDVECWEKYKQEKYKDRKRKAPCSCRYFKGKIPETHKCYKPVSKWKRLVSWIRLRAFRT